MAGVYDYARGLVKALRESDEGRQMRRLGAKVKADSRLDGLLSQFRTLQTELQLLQLQGAQPSEAHVERLKRLGKTVEAQPLLKEYLEAEHAYGQMLVECQQVLAEAFNPEVPGRVKG